MARSVTVKSGHSRWLASCALALVAGISAAPAWAQDAQPAAQEDANAPADDSSEIVVSGSRIDRPGFESPSPLTRISSEELTVGSRANVGAALADLPQF